MKKYGPDIILEENEEFRDWIEARRRYVSGLIDKWQWLLEGTKKQALPPIKPEMWGSMAILFENQNLHTLRTLSEATTKSDLTLPQKYALPIIRKVFPNLVATKICSLQPMPMSSGGTMAVYYQDVLREDASNTNVVTPDSDYAQSSENQVPKRLKMTVAKQTVDADKKILMATWSSEVEEDAMGALQIDVESTLVQNAALTIQQEIDQIILNEMLVWAGAGNVNWDWDVPATYTSAKDYYQTLGHALIDMEDLVYAQRFTPCGWIVAGRRVVRFIRKMMDFTPEPRNQPFDPFKVGVELVGRITGFWDVYLTPLINQDRAIMGVYPTTQIDAAYVFAPYVPIEAMPKVYGEALPYDHATLPGAYVNTDKWTRNIRTRYAKKLVVPELLSTLSISGT